jgi:hypothetical protein
VGAALLTVVLLGCSNQFAKHEPKTWPGPVVTGACTAAQLPLPAAADPTGRVDITDMDATGHYLVGYQTTERGPRKSNGSMMRQRPMLWDGGVPRMLDVPGTFGVAIAVNSHGWVLGSAEDMSSPGWVLMPGSDAVVPLEGDSPVDINERGEVVGRMGSSGRPTRPVGSRRGP